MSHSCPVGEEPQMPDKDTKAMKGTDDTPGGKASPDAQDLQPSVFHSIKFFVLCHSLLQLSQLMISGYLKSSISTVEKRFGLSSQTSGLLAAFNEVGNTILIVFVSYFGSRVHRPRLIGCGAILVVLAGLLMTFPHFISEPYRYDRTSSGDMSQDFKASLCLPTTLVPAPAASNSSCSSHTEVKHLTVVGIMFMAQTLLGVGAVPIQPFGISYIDDFAHSNNSPLYLGILFAVTLMGPGLAFGLGSVMLRLYVDIDRMPEGGISLTPKDPRWVGAWWLGFLVSAGAVALAAIPYFFFPKEMPTEKHELRFRRRVLAVASKDEDSPSEQSPGEPPEKQVLGQIAPDLTVIQFIKVFPRVLLRTLRHPIFLLVVLSQVCLSCAVAGMATFLSKFLERQFSITASYANMFIGCLSIPTAIMGIAMGGILVKCLHLSPLRCSALCLLGTLFCLLFKLPLFFMGCPTHQIAGITPQSDSQPGLELFPGCMEPCSCPSDDFNPVCDPSTHVEYLTPCHAGCTNQVAQAALNKSQVFYTNCSCVTGGGPVQAGSCDSTCSHLVLPFILLMSLGGVMASLTHTPSFMLILRGVKKEDKALAVGIQFMLLRVLAWMPSPVIHGSAIDTTCVHWAWSCGRRAVCRYYDNDLLRNRFIGLQFFFSMGSLACFALIWAILRQQDKEERTKVASSGLQQQLLESRPEKKPEESRV
ncbi:PREDICTED: solute carrier organic anion transporter family member 2B1 isoform X2 [Hipposideros armiger]|uniref:Solute carrier organic anion transporter family member n=1 Tax=Hipposideros armiger TaxID=186990 RepID=A0A8B7RV96_HIPAR|nr:PREDICTED: solute carrier organic anion transporter family member 2B1 isoform X2 [Hipposideros armiger]XP_019504938.1 PREDICTED: solute carrier organic anion transporter family member 2B1 isoform X2 [Hipposideros armiger]XP_019504939.1 PREDICTED: solute carrier organic anion transporter family member 2B1 isoform X2 [Hipposideros armiger]XP_019504940.1 PREDICTED: solute carrier organic anion transporter family member 2B1 isoform X2 [Hipposideros armiger]